MKKYKTWEVFKMLDENKNKNLEFMCTVEEGLSVKYDSQEDTISFYYKSNSTAISDFVLCEEWELIQHSVTWDEVLESDKDCKVCHELLNKVNFLNDEEFDIQEFDRFDVVIYFLSKVLDAQELRIVIKEGKWYLEN